MIHLEWKIVTSYLNKGLLFSLLSATDVKFHIFQAQGKDLLLSLTRESLDVALVRGGPEVCMSESDV